MPIDDLNVCQTERLTLRQFTLDDTDFIIELVNSPGWLTYIGDRNIHTHEQAYSYMQNSLFASYEQHGYGLYRVGLKHNDTPIGMCGLVKRAQLPHPDIGFAFLPAYTQKGYALEAATAIQALAYTHYNTPTLYAIILPGNEASIKLVEKFGMKYEEPYGPEGELLLYSSESEP